MRETRVAAARTPAKIEIKALLRFISSRDATRAPVQAPVPGSGIATKRKSPHVAYFVILSLFLSAFFKTKPAVLLKKLILE